MLFVCQLFLNKTEKKYIFELMVGNFRSSKNKKKVIRNSFYLVDKIKGEIHSIIFTGHEN